MSRRQSRQRQLKREKIIFVEGDTEEYYFNMLRQRYHGGNVKVKIQNKSGLKAVTLVDEAISWLANHRAFTGDAYVCFDNDDQSEELLIKSFNRARKNNIHMIYSDICIEDWLLMHFTPVQGGPSNWRQKSWLFRQLEKHLNIADYPGHKGSDLTAWYEDRILDADRYCRQLTGNRPLDGAVLGKKQVYTNFNQAIRGIFELETF